MRKFKSLEEIRSPRPSEGDPLRIGMLFQIEKRTLLLMGSSSNINLHEITEHGVCVRAWCSATISGSIGDLVRAGYTFLGMWDPHYFKP